MTSSLDALTITRKTGGERFRHGPDETDHSVLDARGCHSRVAIGLFGWSDGQIQRLAQHGMQSCDCPAPGS